MVISFGKYEKIVYLNPILSKKILSNYKIG